MSRGFRYEFKIENGVKVLYLTGVLSEHSSLDLMRAEITGPTIFDLENVERINSAGIQEWIRFQSRITSKGPHLYRRCSPLFIEAINITANMLGNAKVESVMAPYFCNDCDTEQLAVVDTTTPPIQLPDVQCERCGQPIEFDAIEARFFAFLYE